MALSTLLALLLQDAPADSGSSGTIKIVSGLLAVVLVVIIVLRRKKGGAKKDEDEF